MKLTEDQEIKKELLQEYCRLHGMRLVPLLARERKVGETVGEMIERVWDEIEADTTE